MADSPATDTTQLLRAWAGGDERALTDLVPRVHIELRRLAGRLLQNERSGFTLQTADLVQEVYLRLVDIHQLDWQHGAHFFAVSATMMRRILLDRARRHCAAKRGRRLAAVDIDKAVDLSAKRSQELIALDDALNALAEIDPRKARIVELRFFAGLEVKETAEVVGVFPRDGDARLEIGPRLAFNRIETIGFRRRRFAGMSTTLLSGRTRSVRVWIVMNPHRREFLHTLAGGATALSLSRAAFADATPEASKLTDAKLTDRVTLITGAGNNIVALAGDGGSPLVDGGDAAHAPDVLKLAGSVRTVSLRWQRQRTIAPAEFPSRCVKRELAEHIQFAGGQRPQRFIADGKPRPVEGPPGLSSVCHSPNAHTLEAEARREDGSVVGKGVYKVLPTEKR